MGYYGFAKARKTEGTTAALDVVCDAIHSSLFAAPESDHQARPLRQSKSAPDPHQLAWRLKRVADPRSGRAKRTLNGLLVPSREGDAEAATALVASDGAERLKAASARKTNARVLLTYAHDPRSTINIG
jgi:hypothetical protein